MNYNYTACCWFPTSSNILILPSQFWQIRFESYWLHCSKCRILVLLRYWFSSGTGVRLGHCIIFCHALGCPAARRYGGLSNINNILKTELVYTLVGAPVIHFFSSLILSARISFFTSGSENLHYVERVTSGTRYAITVSFTCDREKAIKYPSMGT